MGEDEGKRMMMGDRDYLSQLSKKCSDLLNYKNKINSVEEAFVCSITKMQHKGDFRRKKLQDCLILHLFSYELTRFFILVCDTGDTDDVQQEHRNCTHVHHISVSYGHFISYRSPELMSHL